MRPVHYLCRFSVVTKKMSGFNIDELNEFLAQPDASDTENTEQKTPTTSNASNNTPLSMQNHNNNNNFNSTSQLIAEEQEDVKDMLQSKVPDDDEEDVKTSLPINNNKKRKKRNVALQSPETKIITSSIGIPPTASLITPKMNAFAHLMNNAKKQSNKEKANLTKNKEKPKKPATNKKKRTKKSKSTSDSESDEDLENSAETDMRELENQEDDYGSDLEEFIESGYEFRSRRLFDSRKGSQRRTGK